MATVKRGFERVLRVFLLVLAAGMAAGTAQAGTTEAPQADIQPINLIDQRGRTVTQKDFIGKPSLIFFGFTPRSARLPWQRSRPAWRLGPLAERLNVIFVTADPERDTPEILREYLGSFDRSSD